MATEPTKPVYPESKKIRRLTMWTPDPSAEGERASLEISVRGSNFEIIVWARGPAEKGKPPIRASLNTINMSLLVNNLIQVANSPGKEIADFTTRNMRKSEGDASKREIHDQAIVRVCKSAEGIVFLGVFDADESRSRILFPFMLDRWTHLVKRSGESMSEAEVSKMVAIATAEILNEVKLRFIEITTDVENKELYGGGTATASTTKKAYGNYGNKGGDGNMTDSYL